MDRREFMAAAAALIATPALASAAPSMPAAEDEVMKQSTMVCVWEKERDGRSVFDVYVAGSALTDLGRDYQAITEDQMHSILIAWSSYKFKAGYKPSQMTVYDTRKADPTGKYMQPGYKGLEMWSFKEALVEVQF